MQLKNNNFTFYQIREYSCGDVEERKIGFFVELA